MRNNMNDLDRSAKMLILGKGALNKKWIQLNFYNIISILIFNEFYLFV